MEERVEDHYTCSDCHLGFWKRKDERACPKCKSHFIGKTGTSKKISIWKGEKPVAALEYTGHSVALWVASDGVLLKMYERMLIP